MASLRRWMAGLGMCLGLLGAICPGVAEPLDVVVTIKPVHAIVAAVMEGAGTPHLLLDGAASPHTYAMRPSDVSRLGKARLVVRVSAQLEVFLTKPLAQAKPARLVTLDEIPGMTLLKLRAGGDFEPHAHGSEGHGRDDHGHGHNHGSDAKGLDSHIWLDPRNARLAALRIAEVLAEMDPAEAQRFRRNGDAVAARMDALDARLALELKAVDGRPFLVFHDAYQYLERRYDLAVVGAVTVNPDVPPSARRLTDLRSRIAKSKAVCVFAEPQFAPRAIDTILEGTTVRRGTLDPLGAALQAGPGQYFELMEGLVRDLKSCLLPS